MNHYQSFSTLLAPCSPPEATLLSVRTKDRDLWEGPTLEPKSVIHRLAMTLRMLK